MVHQTSLSEINIHYLFEELDTRKYVDGESTGEHTAYLLDLSHRITNSGEKLEDLHLAHAMVLSLPKTASWELVKIPSFELETFDLDLVSTRLLQKANRRTREKNGGDTAFFVKGTKGPRSPRRNDWRIQSTSCLRRLNSCAKSSRLRDLTEYTSPLAVGQLSPSA